LEGSYSIASLTVGTKKGRGGNCCCRRSLGRKMPAAGRLLPLRLAVGLAIAERRSTVYFVNEEGEKFEIKIELVE
jgi:hypothetical protein